MNILIILNVVLSLIVVVLIILNFKNFKTLGEKINRNSKEVSDFRVSTDTQLKNIKDNNSDFLRSVKEEIKDGSRTSNEKLDGISNNLNNNLISLNKSFSDTMSETNKNLSVELLDTKSKIKEDLMTMDKDIKDSLLAISKENSESSKEINETLKSGLLELQQSNEQKLTQIQNNVNEKLDKSLNERLDTSFEKIGSQLSDLYKSLGELNSMQNGINNLNKTLTNVKTRGTWGEMQLQDIIEQTMQPSQYARNYKIKRGCDDLVEFVIKIPSKDESGDLLLPIDSKFPTDMYLAVIDASESGNKELLEKTRQNLSNRIKEEAKKIREKYIDPPITTDFAILFLPTESMYAEVLRINGLAEFCQNNYKIVVSGPSTITALLNSLRLGFANLTLNKKTQEIKKTLAAVKSQYEKFGDEIIKAQDKIDKAGQSLEAIKKRNDMVQSKIKNIDALELDEADELLGITENTENND